MRKIFFFVRLDKLPKKRENVAMRNQRRKNKAQKPENVPTDAEMAESLGISQHAALEALTDLRIAMRHIAGGQSLKSAYALETGAKGNNSSRWAKKPGAQFWLNAVQLAKEAETEAIAAAIEGSQLAILADPEAAHRDKTAAAALLAKLRGLDRVKIEVETKPAWQSFVEAEMAACATGQSLPDSGSIDI